MLHLYNYVNRFTYAAAKSPAPQKIPCKTDHSSYFKLLEDWRRSEKSIAILKWRWWSNGIYYSTMAWVHILVLMYFILIILSTVIALWICDIFLYFIIYNRSQTDCNHLLIRNNSCNYH